MAVQADWIVASAKDYQEILEMKSMELIEVFSAGELRLFNYKY